MNIFGRIGIKLRARRSILSSSLLFCAMMLLTASISGTAWAQRKSQTPSQTVEQFYRSLHERKFREAFAISIYKPAVEPLNESELTELRPDFEKIAAAIPASFHVSGEQISGETATVFVKIGPSAESPLEPVTLMLAPEGWIVGDKDNHSVVKKSGKAFFFKARVETHHAEIDDLMVRTYAVQTAYRLGHDGLYADLPKLIELGYLPKDLEGTETTGYRLQIILNKDKKGYLVTAEPASYGRSGKLSFSMDQSGVVKSKDVKGKPLAR